MMPPGAYSKGLALLKSISSPLLVMGRWESSSPAAAKVTIGSFKNVKIHNPSAAWLGNDKGITTEEAGKKPVKLRLEGGETYSYCTCGLSGRQPWCDGSEQGYSQQRPISFEVDKTADYWLCLCKTSKSQPICDGSHKFVSPEPKDLKATRRFAVATDTDVYEGVALKLGYKTQGGGFQRG